MPIKEFLGKGWLAPYKYYSVPFDSRIRSEIDSIKEFGIDGDYKTSALEQVVDTGHIRAQLLDSYFEFVKGKRASSIVSQGSTVSIFVNSFLMRE